MTRTRPPPRVAQTQNHPKGEKIDQVLRCKLLECSTDLRGVFHDDDGQRRVREDGSLIGRVRDLDHHVHQRPLPGRGGVLQNTRSQSVRGFLLRKAVMGLNGHF